MKLYQVDIPIAATLYVKAESAKEAAKIARAWDDAGIYVDGDEIDGRFFDECLADDDFTAALSPAMTVGGFPMGDRSISDIEADDMEESE